MLVKVHIRLGLFLCIGRWCADVTDCGVAKLLIIQLNYNLR